MGRNSLMITSLLTVICGCYVFGRLITKPDNQAPNHNFRNLSMTCSSTLGSSNITWYFVPAGQSNNSTIASGSVVYPAFTQLYLIDQPTRNDSNLLIRFPSDSTTGTFTCADSEMVAHAQVILSYNSPFSTKASDSLLVDDIISLSCSLSYLGNPFFTPFFNLYIYKVSSYELLQNNTSPQVNKTNSKFTATATFYVTVPCLTSLQMFCGIMHQRPVGNLLPGSATNAPIQSIGTYSLQRNVSCVPTDNNLRVTGAISGSSLYAGSVLACNVTSIPPANYSWTDLTYGNSSIGPYLTVWHNGAYRCTASNYVRGSWYSGSKAVYNVTVDKLSSTATPLFGPVAGGTKVTVTLENWSKQVTNISSVYLGGILETTIIEINRFSNSFMMITSNVTTALTGQPLPITIEFVPGPYNLTTNLSFTYQGDPEITGISPTTFLVTGGTLVTATGTRLSSVADLIIRAVIAVERGIEKNTTSEVSSESCEVKAEDGSEMICRMPPIKIPDDFLQILDSSYSSRITRDTDSMNHITAENLFLLSRRKRYLSALSILGPNGVDRLVIYIGLILDGYRKYENINDVLPETQLLFLSPPQISSSKDVLEFDPNEDEFISIMGRHMTRGVRLNDYLVKIGADVCENIHLTDHELICRPPKQKPQPIQGERNVCDPLLNVHITIGFMYHHYACMKYAEPSSPVALIIGLSVGLSSLVTVIPVIVAIVFCYKRCRKIRKPADKTLETKSDSVYEAYIEPFPHSDYEEYRQPTAESHDYLDLELNKFQ